MWLGVYGVANETRENDRQVKSAVETVLNLGKISRPQEILALKIKAVLRAKVVEDFFNVGL